MQRRRDVAAADIVHAKLRRETPGDWTRQQLKEVVTGRQRRLRRALAHELDAPRLVAANFKHRK